MPCAAMVGGTVRPGLRASTAGGTGGRIKLDALCKALGIEGKPDDIDGSKVWDFVKAGEHQKVCDYCADDVRKTREIYQRMTGASHESHQ